MKTQYVLPILFTLATALTSTQVTASGLSYDPYENYYRDYYGIDFDGITKAAIDKAKKELAKKSAERKTKKIKNDSVDMADPTNFYKW